MHIVIGQDRTPLMNHNRDVLILPEHDYLRSREMHRSWDVETAPLHGETSQWLSLTHDSAFRVSVDCLSLEVHESSFSGRERVMTISLLRNIRTTPPSLTRMEAETMLVTLLHGGITMGEVFSRRVESESFLRQGRAVMNTQSVGRGLRGGAALLRGEMEVRSIATLGSRAMQQFVEGRRVAPPEEFDRRWFEDGGTVDRAPDWQAQALAMALATAPARTGLPPGSAVTVTPEGRTVPTPEQKLEPRDFRARIVRRRR